ncbi:MAG: MMPL family transporter [Deltaproteobacteria bacterium]|nr:MMPL family transporter [Deltaproteobacteria bacterium]
MLRKYVEFIVRYRAWVVAANVAVTLFLGFSLRHLRVEVDPDKNLPQGHPYIKAQNEIDSIFGGKNVVVIGIAPKDGDIFQPALLQKVQRITDKLLLEPGIIRANVLSVSANRAKDIVGTEEGMTVTPFMEYAPESPGELATLKTKLLRNPLYSGSIFSKDMKSAAILADFHFTPELPDFPSVHREIEKIIGPEADGTVEIHYSGFPIAASWMAKYSERMAIYFLIAVVVIGLVHYEAFRTFQGLILPLLTALLAVIWGLGLMGLAGIALDPFNATTPILILAVGAGHAVQILKRYYEEFAVSKDNHRAVIDSTVKVGTVMMTTGVIAMLAFFSLLTFQTTTIRTFGLFTGLGIFAVLIIEMTLIPAMRAMLPSPKLAETNAESVERKLLDGTLERLAPFVSGGGSRTIIVVAAIAFLAWGYGSSRVNIDNSLKPYFSSKDQFFQDDTWLNDRFAGTNTLLFVVEGPGEDSLKDPKVLEAMEGLQNLLQKEEVVGKTMSIVDFVKKMNRSMNADDPKFDSIPDSRELVAQYLFLYSISGGPDDFDAYVTKTYDKAIIQAFLKKDNTSIAEAIIGKVKGYLATEFPPGYNVKIAGSIASSDAMNQVMVQGKIRNIGQIWLIVILLSAIVLRSFVAGLLVTVPLVLSVFGEFALLGYAGWNLDIGTSAILPMAVGIGADYALYFIFRMKEELHKNPDFDKALLASMRTSGKAVFFVSSAITAGYLCLALSPFGFHRKLGILVALAMVISSLGAITVLPALLKYIRPKSFMPSGSDPEKH